MNKLVLVLILAGVAQQSSAQTFNPRYHTIALSKDGILVGRHAKADTVYSTVDDTVDAKALQSVHSLSGIYFDKDEEIHTMTPAEFQMIIVHNTDTTTLESMSSFLTRDMTASLKGISSGDKVCFQYIAMKPVEDSESFLYTMPLYFFVR